MNLQTFLDRQVCCFDLRDVKYNVEISHKP